MKVTRRARAQAPAGAPVALTAEECERARRLLMRRDARLAPLVRRVGRCRLPDSRTHHPFVALTRALVAQQLSSRAASTIFARVLALTDGVEGLTPARALALDVAALRGAGVSRQKAGYLRDLAEHVASGRLDLDRLERQPDDEVVAAITAVKGFGRWSAEMFLMFRLNRPDIFPVGDLGIVRGMQVVLGMKRRPKPVTMLRAAEAWRPYRSVAAWYLWRVLEP